MAADRRVAGAERHPEHGANPTTRRGLPGHAGPGLTLRPNAVVRRGLPLVSLGALFSVAGAVFVCWRAGHPLAAGHTRLSEPWQAGVAACLLGVFLLVAGIGYLSSTVTITHDRIRWRWHFVRSEVVLVDVVGVTLARPRSHAVHWSGLVRPRIDPSPGSVLHLVHRRRGAIRVDPVVIRRSASTDLDAARICGALERAVATDSQSRHRGRPAPQRWPWTARTRDTGIRMIEYPSTDRWVPPLWVAPRGGAVALPSRRSRPFGPFLPRTPSLWN